jgi:hypothetical protein
MFCNTGQETIKGVKYTLLNYFRMRLNASNKLLRIYAIFFFTKYTRQEYLTDPALMTDPMRLCWQEKTGHSSLTKIRLKLEICTIDQSTLKYILQLCLGANTTSTICYNLLKLKTQKLQVLVMTTKLEIFRAYKSSITIQKICLGVNATSTIHNNFLKLRAQNPRVLVVDLLSYLTNIYLWPENTNILLPYTCVYKQFAKTQLENFALTISFCSMTYLDNQLEHFATTVYVRNMTNCYPENIYRQCRMSHYLNMHTTTYIISALSQIDKNV